MSMVLKQIGKNVDIVCKDQIPDGYKFVSEVSGTKVLDLDKIELNKYDFIDYTPKPYAIAIARND